MPMPRRAEDEYLPNGSIICWSRLEGKRVVVRCGHCSSEHLTHTTNVRKPNFTGLCRSCAHSGELSSTWRGGRKEKYGYIYVKLLPNHPFYAMADTEGYLAEHRLVMAEQLGRPLDRTEVVDHINGIKSDNRSENLQVFPSQQAHRRYHLERTPHNGYEPADIRAQIRQRLKDLFGLDE